MLVDDFICAMKEILVWLVDGVGWILNFLIGWLLTLLPASPFIFEPVQWGPFGQLIGYFIPVADMMSHLSYLLIATAMYYVIRHLLRMVRMVQ